MKKLIYTIMLLIAFSVTAPAQWVRITNGISGAGNILCLTINGNNSFAGTDNGIYLSTNFGINWTSINNTAHVVNAIITFGTANVLAGTNNGIYLSNNNGTNWIKVNDSHTFTLTISGSKIYAGTNYEGSILMSIDNGATWTSITNGMSWTSVNSILVLGNNIILAFADNSIFKTTNGGVSWVVINNTTYTLSMIASGTNIFRGSQYDGVFMSTNNGDNWVNISGSFTGRQKRVYSLAVYGNNLFAGTDSGLVITTNNGVNWIPKNQGYNSNSLKIYEVLVSNDSIFSMNNSNSIWRRGIEEAVNVKKISSEIPSKYTLSQNFPNPWNPSTKINFTVTKSGLVTLKVYDITGKDIATLVNENQSPGTYSVDFNASNLTSGTYFYKLQAGNFTETKRMLLIK